MPPRVAESRDVLVFERDRPAPVRETRDIPADISLRLLVNGAHLVTLLCSNQSCEELALGFLFTEGIIEAMEEVREATFHEELYTAEVTLSHELDSARLESTRSMTSGCGRGVTYVDPRVDHLFRPVGHEAVLEVSTLWDRIARFNRVSELHRDVGGVHSCLFEGPQGSVLSEDIGRHNCVDKIAGTLLRRRSDRSAPRAAAPGEAGTLLSSGRVSTEILTKCVRLGVEIVVSRSAPTSSALRLADDFGITVVGYARGGRAVVYAGEERVKGGP